MKTYIPIVFALNVLYFFWIFTFARHQMPFLIMFANAIGIIAFAYACNFFHGVRFWGGAILGGYACSLIVMAITRMVLYPIDQWVYRIFSFQSFMFPILSMGWIYGFLCILLWRKSKVIRLDSKVG